MTHNLYGENDNVTILGTLTIDSNESKPHSLMCALHALVFNSLHDAQAPIAARTLHSYCDYNADRVFAANSKELRKYYHCTKLDLENCWCLAIATLLAQRLIKAEWSYNENETIYKCNASFAQFCKMHKRLEKGGK